MKHYVVGILSMFENVMQIHAVSVGMRVAK